MANSSMGQAAIRHIIGAAVLVLPLFFLLIGVQDAVQGTATGGLGHRLTTAGFYYLVYVLPVVGGAGIHFWITRAVLGKLSPLVQRVASILLSVTLPIAVRLTGESTDSILNYPIPLAVTLVIYGLLTPIGRQPGRQAKPAG